MVKAVDRAGAAVVNISTETLRRSEGESSWSFPGDRLLEEFFRDFLAPLPGRRSRTSLGSGVIIDPKGLILTNEHVVRGAKKIRVVLADHREFRAELVGSDPPSDLALLRISARGKLPTIPLGRSDDLMIGETVIAIGNPFGLSHTVTTGVVSALNRSVRTGDRVYHDFIQTDAAINPGNSGGPLLNIDGELIGINTAIYRKGEGVGFAIPVDRAKRIVEELIRYGEVRPSWIGIEVQDLDESLARYFRLEGRGGVLVTGVVSKGPADQAGIRKGDVILGLGPLFVPSSLDFYEALLAYPAGSALSLTVLRRGRIRKLPLTTGVLDPKRAGEEARRILGLTVEEGNRPLREDQSEEPTPVGILVGEVRPQSLAQRAGLRPGDRIREVDGLLIRDLDDYRRAMVKAMRRSRIVLLIQRGPYGYRLTLELARR